MRRSRAISPTWQIQLGDDAGPARQRRPGRQGYEVVGRVTVTDETGLPSDHSDDVAQVVSRQSVRYLPTVANPGPQG